MHSALPTSVQQHTLGHVQCPACEALKRMIIRTGELGHLTFSEVWPIWWEVKEQEIGKKTRQCYHEYFRQLVLFFGSLVLKEIHIGHIVAYRKDRMVTAGPNLINHEMNALRQMLDFCGLWGGTTLAKHYKQLKVKKGGPGQTITDQEAEWLFEVAQMKPRWRLAYLCALVSSATGAGAKEVLSLRLKDIDFNGSRVSFIEGTKDGAERPRTIPMNDDCRWALAEACMLAGEKGAEKPDHYIFPKRATKKGGKTQITEHMESNFRAWYAIRKFAARKFPSLAFMGRNKLRHYALTRLAENQNVSENTVKQIAGHGPYSRMLVDHYLSIREKAQRIAVDALPSMRKSPASVQNQAELSQPPKESIQ